MDSDIDVSDGNYVDWDLKWTLSVDPNFPYPEVGAGNGGGGTIYRLREGVERFMITDINNPAGSAMAQSELPISWDFTMFYGESLYDDFNHIPGGSNVLYMNGHVAFTRYPAQYDPAPMTVPGARVGG